MPKMLTKEEVAEYKKNDPLYDPEELTDRYERLLSHIDALTARDRQWDEKMRRLIIVWRETADFRAGRSTTCCDQKRIDTLRECAEMVEKVLKDGRQTSTAAEHRPSRDEVDPLDM